MELELRDRWAALAGTAHPAQVALASLLARYREPHRRYHGLAHLVRALRGVDELLREVPVPDPDAVRFAAWYHDAVYDPVAPAGANEQASARLARDALLELGQPDARATTVARLVRATATHHATDTAEAVLIDADLAVLAADPSTYDAYVRGVRREYGHLDDQTWRSGRADVLQGFLDRPHLFHTAWGQAQEDRARANLAAELAGLRPRS